MAPGCLAQTASLVKLIELNMLRDASSPLTLPVTQNNQEANYPGMSRSLKNQGHGWVQRNYSGINQDLESEAPREA